jgi:hypothetical protein
LLFRHVPGLRNRAGIRPGIDVRATGGFIVAPPSRHPETRRQYAWEVDHHPLDMPIAEAPEWLVELVRHRAPLDLRAAGNETPTWLEIALNLVDEGARNDTATRLTGHLLRRYCEPRLAYCLLSAWNATHCRPPLPQAELSRTFQSVLALEMRRRRNSS